MLMVSVILTIIATAHISTLTHLRNVQGVAKQREALVRDAHNLVEELRSDALKFPDLESDGSKTLTLERDSGRFIITCDSLEAQTGGMLQSHLVHGEFDGPEGLIEINLPVLLPTEKGDDS